ncbi:MAG: two-component sensor histidine kinase, partial [Deltaproteobacteria bacterium]
VLKGEIEVGLKRQRRPEEYRRVLASCLEEVDRMSRIVDDLLTLARADMGALQLQKERVDLGEVAEGVWRSLGRIAEEKGLRFTFQRDGEVAVWGDKDRLRQLLVNLVDNALKYTPPGGEVRLRVERDDTLALLTVQDTGEGIPPEDQERVFERFYRVDKARSRQRGGTGLGLSICKWIAEAHGGKISLESEVGKGSTFVVQLPLLAP